MHKTIEKLFLFFIFKEVCYQIFLERGDRWRVADSCRKRVPDLGSLKVEGSVSSRFVNFYISLFSALGQTLCAHVAFAILNSK